MQQYKIEKYDELMQQIEQQNIEMLMGENMLKLKSQQFKEFFSKISCFFG